MASDGLNFVRKIYCVNQFRAQYGKLFISSLFVCADITETDFRTKKIIKKLIWFKCDHRKKCSKSIKSCWNKSSGRFVSSSDYYKSSLVHSNPSRSRTKICFHRISVNVSVSVQHTKTWQRMLPIMQKWRLMSSRTYFQMQSERNEHGLSDSFSLLSYRIADAVRTADISHIWT